MVNALFDNCYDTLVRYACRSTGTLEEAEECVQDAFLQLFHTLISGVRVENPLAYTFCVVRRGAARARQKHKRSEAALREADVVQSPELAPELEAGELDRLLSILTRRELEVVLLRLESMKYREIARALGISASSVNVLLARAIRKLHAFRTTSGSFATPRQVEARELKTLL